MDEENVVSRLMDNVTTVVSKNGKLEQRFSTPLLENYEFAKEPFEEYRKGIDFTRYDSLEAVSSGITSDYALHWTKRDLWELKGNVVASGSERTLFTQQLFWDRKIKRFYSNVDSKVVEGDDVYIGEGFEADEGFGRWTFRKLKGTISVDTEPVKPADPVTDSAAVSTTGAAQAAGNGVPANAAAQDADKVFPNPNTMMDARKDAPKPQAAKPNQPVPLKLETGESL